MKISTAVCSAGKFCLKGAVGISILYALPYLIRPEPIKPLDLPLPKPKIKREENPSAPVHKHIDIPNIQNFPRRENKTIFI